MSEKGKEGERERIGTVLSLAPSGLEKEIETGREYCGRRDRLLMFIAEPDEFEFFYSRKAREP